MTINVGSSSDFDKLKFVKVFNKHGIVGIVANMFPTSTSQLTNCVAPKSNSFVLNIDVLFAIAILATNTI
jgi:hypothetical protein